MVIITRTQAKEYIDSEKYLVEPKAGLYQDGDEWIGFNFYLSEDHLDVFNSESEAMRYIIK